MGNIESSLISQNEDLAAAALDIRQETERINDVEIKIGKETRNKLFTYIAYAIPLILKKEKVSGVEKAILDRTKWDELVKKPLCRFICNEEPDIGLENLRMLDNPPELCGKVFEVGDPTYTCKDCATDPTCVFCHDCFNKSSHVNHRYRMHASSGNGGYCDCGDNEAWKKDPCCEVHLKGKDFDSDQNPKDVLPAKVLEKATFVYRELLQYCVDMILWTERDVLPDRLRRWNVTEEEYLTLLYNDEVHTYDQVIRSLQQSLNCDKSQAIRFATIVDKEGRSLIFSGLKESCQDVCRVLKRRLFRDDHGTLECIPIRYDIVAHQEAAIELLTLLNKITSYSAGLRRLLCELSLNTIKPRPEPLLDQLLKSDTDLWKVARAGYHQLFMNAVLLDPYGKKEFSKTFARHYKKVMSDFVKDDHEHSLSASSVSVQIFTVPTISHMLTLEYNILKVVLETFYEHIENSFTDAGHIDFQTGQNGNSLTLKREYYILHDIGYLLHNKPESWTPQIVEKFLSAFDVFARIMKGMQGMEQVVRKLVTHIEYEPNWESGFLMQLWMMPIIEAMVSWCISDAGVLQEAMKICLEILLTGLRPRLKVEPKIHQEVDPNFMLVNYDVATQPASVHMGLSRFIAGLVTGCLKNRLSLEKLLRLEGLTSDLITWQLLALLEYPLRTLVFAAQVSAGMWRRNGYAVLHQVSYYQNVRCVSEMYDRDIIMLQTVAALMNSNHFLTVLLEKYGLLDWLRLGFEETGLDEDSQRRIIVISEEFLLTVLAVLGERHVLGIGEVTSKDILRKEVVHRLALGPSSRSEIVKNLPSKDPDDEEDCTFESQLDDVLKTVADFRQPGLTGKGLYQLKPQCLEEWGQYFYHYSRSEQSKALEQRRKQAKKSTTSCSSRVPVPATFTKLFMPITKIFCCDKMSKILTVVLFRASKSESKITPDTLIEEALYIIALGLFEERRKRENKIVTEENFLDVVTRTLGVVEGKPVTIERLLEEIQSKQKNQEYSDLVSWIVKILHEELSHHNDEKDDMNQQNKRKQDEIDHGAKADKERRARLAKEKRDKVMAQMSQMQKSFIKKYETLLDLDEYSKASEDVEMEESFDSDKSVAVGPNRTITKPKIANIICILCQEKEDITAEARTVVMAAFTQRSKVLSKSKDKNINDIPEYNPLFTPRDLFTGVFTSSCGHVMHGECWQKYFDSVKDKERRQLLRLHSFHNHIDVTKNEYLCPLCSSLCNTVIPVLPELDAKSHQGAEFAPSKMESDGTELSTEETLSEMQKYVDDASEDDFIDTVQTKTKPKSSSLSSSTLTTLFYTFLYQRSNMNNSSQTMVQKFASTVHSIGLPTQHQERVSELLMTWSTCAYTIQCTECILREEKKPLFALSSRQNDCISSLVRFALSSCLLADEEEVNRNCLNLLSALVATNTSHIVSPSILDLDIFGVMLNLRFTLQTMSFTQKMPLLNMVESGSIDQFVLKIAIQAQLTQILLCCPEEIKEFDESLKNLANSQIEINLAELWGKMKHVSGSKFCSDPHSQPGRLFCHVIAHCLPFLRCCALFFHFLTGAQPPAILTQQSEHEHVSSSREILAICHYLSLPLNVVSILPMENAGDAGMAATDLMIQRWCKNDSVKLSSWQPNIDCPSITSPIRLIPLPKDYSQLITTASGFRCPMTGDMSQNPTMCLVCGELLCSQSYCCQALIDEKQIGSCTAHAEKCNESVGIFLRIRDCQILLLYDKSKGCFKPSPYLDEYGEPDYKFRRGNPLYLSVTRYNNLQKLWLSHLIPEEIVRQMENSRSFLAFEWSQY